METTTKKPRVRITEDEYEIQSNYGYGHGYECVTTETTWKEARAQIKCYRENEPGIPFRIVCKTPIRTFSLSELEALPTLSQGHFDNLKIETKATRVWLSRMTIEDGMKYNNQVTVERLVNGTWKTINQYEAL